MRTPCIGLLCLRPFGCNSLLSLYRNSMKAKIWNSPSPTTNQQLSWSLLSKIDISIPSVDAATSFSHNHSLLQNDSSALDSDQVDQDDNKVSLLTGSYWNLYKDTMSKIMTEHRVVKKSRDIEPVNHFLLHASLPERIDEIFDSHHYQNSADEGTIELDPKATAEFRSHMSIRLGSFLNEWNFTKDQKAYMDRCFTYLGDRCAAMQIGEPLVIAWLKWRQSGSMPRENSISTYMYALGLKMNQMDDDPIRTKCLWDVVSMHGLLFPLNEKTITLRIQSLIAQQRHASAEKLVFSLSQSSNDASDTWKLRTFAPILSYYCNEGDDLVAALQLFRKMRSSKSVHLDAATYAMLLGAIASRGYFNPGSDMQTDMGFISGPKLFDDLVTHMAYDLLELTEDAVNALYKGFLVAAHDDANNLSSMGPIVVNETIPEYSRVGNINFGRVTINASTGICEATGVKLRMLTLDEQQREHVRQTLLDMAYSLQEEYRATAKVKSNLEKVPTGDYCRDQLLNFSNWLAGTDEPFTAFVDGANVAHFGSGVVQYSQVKLMVDELLRLGENPVVIMPEKYATRKFYLRHLDTVQELKDKDMEIIDELTEKGLMFVVPRCCFDDYYWMIASVSVQNQSNTIPGHRPILITNDQMRDHRLSLLEPRPFRRWTSCQVVNFSIDGYVNDEWETGRIIALFPPRVFSREMQSNELYDKPGQMIWHFPVTGWDELHRLCICVGLSQ